MTILTFVNVFSDDDPYKKKLWLGYLLSERDVGLGYATTIYRQVKICTMTDL